MRRLVAYYLLCLLLLAAVVMAVGIINRNAVERFAAVTALAFYALANFAVAIRDELRVEPLFGIDGAIWLAVSLILTAVLLTRWRWMQIYVLVLGVLLFLGTAVQIGAARLEPGIALPTDLSESWSLSPTISPNIYWFVLDGYGRQDVLAADYGFPEQSRFFEDLSSRGFATSTSAVAAYPLTYLSMASTLTAEYFTPEDADLLDPGPYVPAIQGENRVVATLRSWGYEYVHVDNGWTGSGCSGRADVCVATGYAGEVEWELLSMTPFARLIDGPMSRSESERTNPVIAVERVREAQPERPFFAQIHLINPHPPHFNTSEECSFQVVSYDLAGPYGDAEYVEAIRCLNRRLLEAVDQIQASDPDAIIIMQGDHGPATFAIDVAPLDRWTDHDVQVRYGVLSVMRLPEGCLPPDDMSLVNTFRVVFNCIAVEELPLLPARAWLVNTYPGGVREVTPPNGGGRLSVDG